MTNYEHYKNVLDTLDKAVKNAPNEEMRNIWQQKYDCVKGFIERMPVSEAESK